MSELNIKSSTIEKSLDLAKEFLQKLIGPSIDEIGLTLGDTLKIWRTNNQIKNLGKVQKIVNERGISIKQINLKVLFPYLEGVALEEDDKLQDLWANLFVNYIDTTKNLTSIVYPSILKQLSSDDLKYLDIFESSNGFKNIYLDNQISATDLSNIERLGLIKLIILIPHHNSGLLAGVMTGVADTGNYELTYFGKEFLLACKL